MKQCPWGGSQWGNLPEEEKSWGRTFWFQATSLHSTTEAYARWGTCSAPGRAPALSGWGQFKSRSRLTTILSGSTGFFLSLHVCVFVCLFPSLHPLCTLPPLWFSQAICPWRFTLKETDMRRLFFCRFIMRMVLKQTIKGNLKF